MKELELAKLRSIYIAKQLKEIEPSQLREIIEEFHACLDFSDLENLMISEEAWNQIVKSNIQPRLVFAHPDLLEIHPRTSLYYRGMACLSFEQVKTLAVQVKHFENESAATRLTSDKLLKIVQLYNKTISLIIINTPGWTVEDGYRSIIATIAMYLNRSARFVVREKSPDLHNQT